MNESHLAKSDKKTVFIINPVVNSGHNNMYCNIYCKTFLELDWSVVLISPKDCIASEYVDTSTNENSYKLVNAEIYTTSLINKYKILKRLYSALIIINTWLTKQKPIIRQKNIIYRLAYKLFKTAFKFVWNNLNPANAISLKKTKTAVIKAVKILNVTPDLIFILNLDLLEIKRTKNKLNYSLYGSTPWAGIMFLPKLGVPYNNDIEPYINNRCFKGAFMLVGHLVELYSKTINSKFFYLAPDITDTRLPENDNEIEILNKFKKFAKNRTIILLIGSISKRKKLIEFIKISKRANNQNYCFAIIGRINYSTFTKNEQEYILREKQSNDNLFIHDEYLSDELVYNSFINLSSIIYSIYAENFYGNSNTLTKGSFFKKPILAAEQTYIGNLVAQANIGATCDNNNEIDILNTIDILSKRDVNSFDFNKYYENNAPNQLNYALQEAIKFWLK